MGDEIELLRKTWESAMEKGDIATAKELVDKNIEMYLDEDTCVLLVAVSHGYLELCEWLILQRHQPAGWYNRWGYTVLSEACRNGYLAVCELLLDHGAEVGGIGVNAPFTLAIQNGHTDICKLLLQRGFKINRRKRRELNEAKEGRYLNKIEKFIEKYGEAK